MLIHDDEGPWGCVGQGFSPIPLHMLFWETSAFTHSLHTHTHTFRVCFFSVVLSAPRPLLMADAAEWHPILISLSLWCDPLCFSTPFHLTYKSNIKRIIMCTFRHVCTMCSLHFIWIYSHLFLTQSDLQPGRSRVLTLELSQQGNIRVSSHSCTNIHSLVSEGFYLWHTIYFSIIVPRIFFTKLCVQYILCWACVMSTPWINFRERKTEQLSNPLQNIGSNFDCFSVFVVTRPMSYFFFALVIFSKTVKTLFTAV